MVSRINAIMIRKEGAMVRIDGETTTDICISIYMGHFKIISHIYLKRCISSPEETLR